MRLIVAIVAGALAVGCFKQEGVLRVVDGRVVEGPFIEPEAYAAFLRGAIAEERGELRDAMTAYVEAARADPNDPEIWSRIARVSCVVDARDRAADAALARALSLDPEYSEALAVRAECAMARGDAAGAEEAARRVLAVDRTSTELELLLARATGSRGGVATRDRLIALTLAHGESVAAWDALAAWARTHDDVTLYVLALAELARRAPFRRGPIAAAAVTLAGDGDLAAARALAAALVDAASSDGLAIASSRPIVARLAIDEAILAGDLERTRLRATRSHVGLEEAAGRAALFGMDTLARDLAAPVAAADPQARGARLVLAAVARGDAAALRAAFDGFARGRASEVPAACLLAFARTMAGAISDDEAARVVAATPHATIVQGDAVEVAVAVDLAARGVLVDAELPPDGVVELAARRERPVTAATSLDARHELLALALSRPESPRALELARRLARVRDRDALVAVACARIELARGDAADPARLLAHAPADPLAAATALDVAVRRGDGATAARARATLSALARTPAERARSAQ